MRRWRKIEDNSTGSLRVRPNSLTPQRGINGSEETIQIQKRRAKQAARAAVRFPIVLSTAARSAFNMTVVVVTSGSVLLFLLTAKRFL